MKNYLFLLFALLSNTCLFAQVSFSSSIQYPTGFGTVPTGMVTADFNGDGFLDLANSNGGISGSSVNLFLGNGMGTFGLPTSFPVSNGPFNLATADFNGDGKKDLATIGIATGLAPNKISILLGNGAGSFSPMSNYNTDTFAYRFLCADFNNDCIMDFVTSNANPSNVYSLSVLLGNGSGGFGTPITMLLSDLPGAMTSTDFDGDGKLDVAIANPLNNEVLIFLGNGVGGFFSPNAYSCGLYPIFITNGDFDKDGNKDLALTSDFGGTVSILLGNGNGTFQPSNDYPGGTDPLDIVSVDINGDSKLDLVTASFNSHHLSILLGNGLGGFSLPYDFYLTGPPLSLPQPQSIAIGDFNGDNKLDLATANNGTSNISVLLNTISFSTASINANGAVNLTCLIQGFSDGVNHMKAVLANQSQPTTPLACDSITVELHLTCPPYLLFAATKAVLKQNGTAVCNFNLINPWGRYYLVVKHRNSIETWSSFPIDIDNIPTSYNFTSSASQAYGSNMIEVNPNSWAFYSGDVMKDLAESVDLADYATLQIDINSFAFGYFATDIDGDGNVDLADSPILDINAMNFVYSMHP